MELEYAFNNNGISVSDLAGIKRIGERIIELNSKNTLSHSDSTNSQRGS